MNYKKDELMEMKNTLLLSSPEGIEPKEILKILGDYESLFATIIENIKSGETEGSCEWMMYREDYNDEELMDIYDFLFNGNPVISVPYDWSLTLDSYDELESTGNLESIMESIMKSLNKYEFEGSLSVSDENDDEIGCEWNFELTI